MAQMRVTYDDRPLAAYFGKTDLAAYAPSVERAVRMLRERSGPGADFLGWLDLPSRTTEEQLLAIEEAVQRLRECSNVLITIGIGGSYLGARAAIEFLSPSFDDQRSPRVVFAGHHINSDYLADLHRLVEGTDVAVNVISKSGTTTEPAVVFRLVRQWLEKKYGRAGAARRIIATTDPAKGSLRALALEEGYVTFPIPPDVGGRFSVLSPVGLVPIAYAGFNIRNLVAGALDAQGFCANSSGIDNPAACYAVNRNILFRRGKLIEVMATFQPQLHWVGEWWKQLAGESEGKNLTGIFPTVLDYTTDLHSVGQWMQEGLRCVFETFLLLKKTRSTLTIPTLEKNDDGLNYLSNATLEHINRKAYQGTLLAHIDGGVPAATIVLADRSEETLGQAFYFFEMAIALSGYLLRVNPFDQPGVEAYKNNMFALLGKPEFEQRAAEISARISDLVGGGLSNAGVQAEKEIKKS